MNPLTSKMTIVLAVMIICCHFHFAQGQGCSRYPCGLNAICQETPTGRAVCSCPNSYEGDPLTNCRRVECSDHTECRGDMACKNGKCVNPCEGVCGLGAKCEARNHVAVCSCPSGYRGDPFTFCRLRDPDEQCHPSPCGANTKCEVLNETPTCSCRKGYNGNPLLGCRHECESDHECGNLEFCANYKCMAACDQCGKGASCARIQNHRAVCVCPKNNIGNPYSECRAECDIDHDCPNGRPACVYGVCKNPCDGACGANADCTMNGLTPVCSCPRNMTGDPFVRCRPYTKEDLCTPNPCGANANCRPGFDQSNQERPVCTCLPGYTGNALTSCVKGECQSDNECADDKACISYNCVDPCLRQCGTGATCKAKRHLAICTCPPNTRGDALVTCRQFTRYPVVASSGYQGRSSIPQMLENHQQVQAEERSRTIQDTSKSGPAKPIYHYKFTL